jgi:hypothetical protein
VLIPLGNPASGPCELGMSGVPNFKRMSSWKTVVCGLAIAVLIVVVLLMRQPGSPEPARLAEVEREALILIEGRLHFPGATAPFSGALVERYPAGGLKSRSILRNGLLDGVSEGWHANGNLQVREHFANGVSHGVRTKWYENGTLQSETMIQEGEHHGTFRRWHENGQLAENVEMRQGQPHGVSMAWYPSGFLKTRAVLREGEVVERTFWDDHQMRQLPSTLAVAP